MSANDYCAGTGAPCGSPVKWSGLCEECYLEEFGEEPVDMCDHGNDPNHVPCRECFEGVAQ